MAKIAPMQRILIVDPHTDTAEQLLDKLKPSMFELIHLPFVFSTATIASHEPAIIIVRYNTYGGFADMLCRTIKTTSNTCQIPVILLSNSAHVAHIAHENKADAYLIEPVSPDLLQQTISRLIYPDHLPL